MNFLKFSHYILISQNFAANIAFFNSNLTHCILHLVEGKNKDIIKLHQDKWESSEKLNFNEGTESWTFGAIIQYTNSEMIYHHSKRFKNWFSHYDKIVIDISGYTARKKPQILEKYSKKLCKILDFWERFSKRTFLSLA